MKALRRGTADGIFCSSSMHKIYFGLIMIISLLVLVSALVTALSEM